MILNCFIPNKRELHFLLFFFWKFSYLHGLIGTYVLLTRLFLFGKVLTQTVFYVINIEKNPTYTPLLRPTHLLISEKTSHLHGYQGPCLLETRKNLDELLTTQGKVLILTSLLSNSMHYIFYFVNVITAKISGDSSFYHACRSYHYRDHSLRQHLQGGGGQKMPIFAHSQY